ncbi:hypothetical protein [Crenobacter cavernae]|uniref:PilZ domain-containing protein n=1 Tax=Crenobacter cavernae TaxID=2290923 RepID=A0ABY0FHA2_9NEIS|nr:hypothetical protein [Crenobacter cavernae]RXZ44173.1 hypothetical protein EBB06_06445 [Crenobacter cavernae]
MLDFFSRHPRKKNDPLESVDSAKRWVDAQKEEFGAAAHDRVAAMVAEFNDTSEEGLDSGTLEALLTLNLETQGLHEQLCEQYLMNSRMPRALEGQLRGQILQYGKQFLAAYQRFLSLDFQSEDGLRVYSLMPLVLSRMMHYFGEFARWQFYRHFSPDDVFWLNVNQLFRFGESHGIDTIPVYLFGTGDGQPGTTAQDQFLIVHMLSLLTAGNLSARQIHFTYEVLRLLSNRLAIRRDFSEDASFMIALDAGRPAARCTSAIGSAHGRYWNTGELLDTLHAWLARFEAGKVPAEIKPLVEPGIDAALLRMLCREWAVKPVRFERAERIAVSDRHIEVAYRMPLLHRLIRQPDEQVQMQGVQNNPNHYNDMTDIRIYGFVTSRRKDRLSLAAAGAAVEEVAMPHHDLSQWSVENVSKSGLGVSLDALGNEWVSLGALVGYRETETSEWALGIIRRIRRLARERIFLGIETLSERPVAASLRPLDGRTDMSLPTDQLWHGGQIGLFAPLKRGGRTVNTLILPIASYTLGKQLVMSARGKHFQIALAKVQEKGSDWCLSEVELIRPLDHAPKP